MASAALQSIRRTVTVAWPKHQEAKARAHLLQVARTGHARIMRAQGNPAFEAYANRPGNTNLDSVILPGPIVYQYSSIRQIVEMALDELRKASPVQSGDYVRSHTLFVNGVAVATLPRLISATDEIFIANPIAYARRIEVGKTKAGRDFVLQVPNRIYERVVKNKLQPRYRNAAKITFGYVTVPDAHRIKGGVRGVAAVRRRRKSGEAVRSPAIFIGALT